MHYANHEGKAPVSLSPAPDANCRLNGTKMRLWKVNLLVGEGRGTLWGVVSEVSLKDRAAGAQNVLGTVAEGGRCPLLQEMLAGGTGQDQGEPPPKMHHLQ